MTLRSRGVALAALLVLSCGATTARAEDPAALALPVLDLPDQHGEYAVPTWEQSIEATKAQYQVTHRVITSWAEKRFGRERAPCATVVLTLGWEALANVLPLGIAWAHEEGHRAILDRRGIDSFNGIYDFDPMKGAVYVRDVRDEDLAWLKAEHPAESVRFAAAGMETQTAINLRMERDLFFLRGRIATDWATLVSNTVGNIGYLWVCSDAVFDDFTKLANEEDGAVVARRDALGLDCTAWAYDLVRPDEPYSARGPHPSGVGIDRYLTFSDLSRREKKLLRTVRLAALAQLADPFLWLEDGWGSDEHRFTTALAFQLTSYGWAVDHNVFVASAGRNLLVTVRHGVNGEAWLPAVEASAWRVPVAGFGFFSLGGSVWVQPEGQRWATARAEPGGRMFASLAIPVWRALEVEVAASHKTAGWVPAIASLDEETSVRAGLAWQLR